VANSPQFNPRISPETAEWLKRYHERTKIKGTEMVRELIEALIKHCETHNGVPVTPFEFRIACTLRTSDDKIIRPAKDGADYLAKKLAASDSKGSAGQRVADTHSKRRG